MSNAYSDRLHEAALRYIIPHFASNAELAKGPKVFTGGEGCYIIDESGKRYLDTFASLLTTIVGHCHPYVNQALKDQIDRLEFFPNYVDAYTEPLIELAVKLAEVAPGGLSVSFFVNSGSEANEAAIKMARQFHLQNGQPRRWKVLARRNSYHGTTLGGAAVTGLSWFREYFEPLVPGCVFVPSAVCNKCEMEKDRDYCDLECLQAVEKTILAEVPDTISAMIMDPIPGSNTGYPLPPDGYLQGIRDLCDKYGILLIFDEVQTGFGKTGKWFACEHWGVTPDIMSIGKAISGGYVPLSATLTTQRIAEIFRDEPGKEFRSGGTYGGHTLACAASLAVMQLMEKENLVERTAENGEYMKQELEKLKKHPIVTDIRGLGLLWAIELTADPKLRVGTKIRDWFLDHEMILRNNGDILVLAPPLVISSEQLDTVLAGLDEAIGMV